MELQQKWTVAIASPSLYTLQIHVKDSAADANRRVWGLDLVVPVILQTGDKPIGTTSRLDDNFAGAFIWIVNELVEPDL